MKVAVLVKQVPDTESKIGVSADGASLDLSQVKLVINPYDQYAVEEALRLKEKTGGEVVVVTAGQAVAEQAMREAFAMGADRGIRIETGGVVLDSRQTALALAKACEREKFTIVFAGKKGVDGEYGVTHIYAAERLGWPHCSPVEKFEFDGSNVRMTISQGGGVIDVVGSPLPCVVGCEKGLNEPRYATLPNIMKAKTKPIAVISAEEVIGGELAVSNVVSYSLPPERARGRIITGLPDVAAKELVRLLKEEAKVL